MKYKFSIIIPHRNTPDLLKRCLGSIPVDDAIQIIIVDDGSDASLVDFKKFPGSNRKHVEIVFNKTSKGAGGARNVGVQYIRGEWVVFADADDFFTEAFSSLLTTSFSGVVDLIFFQCNSVKSHDILKMGKRALRMNEYIKQFLINKRHAEINLRYNSTEPWGKLIRSSLIFEHGITFDETSVSNDYWFSVLVGYHARSIAVIPKPFYIVTERDDSLSRAPQTAEKLLERIQVSVKVSFFFKQQKIPLRERFLPVWMWMLLKIDIILFLRQYFKLMLKHPRFMPLLFYVLAHPFNMVLDKTFKSS